MSMANFRLFLSRFDIIKRIAVRVKKQCDSIISLSITHSGDQHINGEFYILDFLIKKFNLTYFIDAGANIGTWTDFVLKYTINHIYLYEPNKNCYNLLISKFKNNKTVTVSNKALSNVSSVCDFYIDHTVGQLSSLNSKALSYTSIDKIECVTLESEFKDKLEKIDFIKIDVEGFDLLVLQGGNGIFSKIRFIQFEYGRQWLLCGSSLIQAINFLKDHEFTLFFIKSNGIEPLVYDNIGDFFGFANLFAARTSDLENLKELIL